PAVNGSAGELYNLSMNPIYCFVITAEPNVMSDAASSSYSLRMMPARVVKSIQMLMGVGDSYQQLFDP
ncbi:hypothetical protein V8D89_016176, partial [Ganoderma adspersum]